MMSIRKQLARSASSIAILSTCFAGLATSNAYAAAAEINGTLEEILVTATRRTTDLQKTPVAVTAMSADQISAMSPRDIGDLAAYVPNFNAARITGFNAASFAMRGVGQNNIIVYFEAPVAVLLDDFVMPSVQSQLLDTFDLESVEVLRGPQGTLFGKNTTGGAVVVHTKKPKLNSTEAEARASYGSFGSYTLQGSANVPVGDKIAVRAVASYEKSDGYLHNGATYGPIVAFVPPNKFAGRSGVGTGEALGGTDVFNGRLKAYFQPSDNFDILAQYEIVRDNSDSPAAVNETPIGNSSFLFNLIGVPQNPGDPLNKATITNRDDALMNMSKGHRVYVDGGYLTMNYDVGPGKLTSVSGFRLQRSRLPSTYTGAAPVAADGQKLSLFDATRDDDRKTWQEELRFASTSDGPFNYVLGGFYQHDQVNFCVNQLLGFLDLASGPLPFGAWNDTPYILCNDQTAKSTALFGEGNYKLTDKLTLTAGARYTWESKLWHGRQQTFVQALAGGFDPNYTWRQLGSVLAAGNFTKYPTGVITDSHKWSEPTWRLSLSYQFTDDLFGYGTYSRGFKSGAYNDQIGGFAAFGTDLAAFKQAAAPTNPEKADSFELGLRAETDDHRLRANLTGFYVQYKDVQKQIVVPIVVAGAPNQVTRFFNAAKMEVKGLEAELAAKPIEGLTLRGVLGFQDGKYKQYTTPIPAGYDLSTAPIDRAPKWQWTLDGTYQMPVSTWGKLSFNANVQYVASSLFTQSITSQSENTFLNAHTLVNASITLSDPEDSKYIRLVGRNLNDSLYKTATQTVGGLWTDTLYGPPRFFGVELGIKFGG